MVRRPLAWFSVLLVVSLVAHAAPPEGPRALVFCAPGYPGTTEEAQPRMTDIAAALADGAGWKGGLTASYFPS